MNKLIPLSKFKISHFLQQLQIRNLRFRLLGKVVSERSMKIKSKRLLVLVAINRKSLAFLIFETKTKLKCKSAHPYVLCGLFIQYPLQATETEHNFLHNLENSNATILVEASKIYRISNSKIADYVELLKPKSEEKND